MPTSKSFSNKETFSNDDGVLDGPARRGGLPHDQERRPGIQLRQAGGLPGVTARQRGDGVKLLLTSSGIANTTIYEALVSLLGKPIEESSALVIPTAIYPFPGGGHHAWEAICGRSKSPVMRRRARLRIRTLVRTSGSQAPGSAHRSA